MAIKLGKDCKAYYSSTLFSAATGFVGGSAVELTNMTDAKTNLQLEEADVTTRATAAAGFKATVGTLAEGSFEFQMNWDPTDASFAALAAAYFARSELAMCFLDGASNVAGAQGLAGNFVVTNFSRDEPLTGAVKADVTVKASTFPHWYTVPSE